MNDNSLLLQQLLACYGLDGATIYPLRNYNNFVYNKSANRETHYAS